MATTRYAVRCDEYQHVYASRAAAQRAADRNNREDLCPHTHEVVEIRWVPGSGWVAHGMSDVERMNDA